MRLVAEYLLISRSETNRNVDERVVSIRKPTEHKMVRWVSFLKRSRSQSCENHLIGTAIYAYGNIVVEAHCTITAASGEASTKSAGIYGYSLTLNGAQVIAGDSAVSATEVDATIPEFRSDSYKYLTIISRAHLSIRIRLIN